MRFCYGKQDWRTLERGEENCYLMTNGLGGFSSLTIIGSCSRNDHAVLMACVDSPNHRYNMIHRLEEILHIGKREYVISSQNKKEKELREEGYYFQSNFVYQDMPVWTYLTEGIEIVKTLALEPERNTIGISYEIRNCSTEDVELEVIPHLQFVPKGNQLPKDQVFVIEGKKICSNGQQLYTQTNGLFLEQPVKYCEDQFYAYDACDGRRETGRTAINHRVVFSVLAGKADTLTMVYGTGPNISSMEKIVEEVKEYRGCLKKQAGFQDKIAQTLSVNANQFLSFRSSTKGQTILAGFPFFEDWGRDTMIAIHGCCLAVHQYQAAESILKTFMSYCKKGLMPNLFPEGAEQPGYNTVDASLLFILAVYEYYRKTNNIEFVQSAYKVMAEIVEYYEKGTDYGIRMDTDGLIMAGKEYDQVTWMDVRVGDILPTPRHGKPVEINAYWYNVLCIMEQFHFLCPEDTKDYKKMAGQVKKSFQKFWNPETGCLKDVLSDQKEKIQTDSQIRCNQIWAVSLPFSVLAPEYERQVVDIVFRKLYTPYGLRTLAPEDKEFCPFYGGAQLERDLAYHQGTVWVFPLGGYYLAYLKVNKYSKEAKNYVFKQLENLEPALREGCIGQLPEIYDGKNPTNSKGCFAQAWSVGEILRVYDALRMTGAE